MSFKHIVVIGTSAGGVSALKNLLTLLPADFPAPVFIVMHLMPNVVSHLSDVINRYSQLPAIQAVDGQSIKPSCIYVAPPNRHLMLSQHKIHLSSGPKINHCRPAIDALFCSAAQFGTASIGVLLTGMLNDGTAGLLAIKQQHGTTIIQDLNEAEYKDMPRSALEHVPIDYCVPIKKMAPLLIKLVCQ